MHISVKEMGIQRTYGCVFMCGKENECKNELKLNPHSHLLLLWVEPNK